MNSGLAVILVDSVVVVVSRQYTLYKSLRIISGDKVVTGAEQRTASHHITSYSVIRNYQHGINIVAKFLFVYCFPLLNEKLIM